MHGRQDVRQGCLRLLQLPFEMDDLGPQIVSLRIQRIDDLSLGHWGLLAVTGNAAMPERTPEYQATCFSYRMPRIRTGLLHELVIWSLCDSCSKKSNQPPMIAATSMRATCILLRVRNVDLYIFGWGEFSDLAPTWHLS